MNTRTILRRARPGTALGFVGPGILGAILVALIMAVFTTGTARADNGPHIKGQPATTDACAGCHRAHTAQAADLLKTDVANLCYTCHDGSQATTNVQQGISTGGGALRGGGFSSARLNTQDPTACDLFTGDCVNGAVQPSDVTIGVLGAGQPTTSAHSVDGSLHTLWGNGAVGSGAGAANFALSCATCHDPHGNGNYRILRPLPAAESTGVDTRPAGVAVPDENPKVYTTSNYFDVSYKARDSMSRWCIQCHTRYESGAGGATRNTNDPIFRYRHSANDSGFDPMCIQCHLSHGTNAASNGGNSGHAYANSVPWPDGTAATPGANSRLLRMDNRGICQKCHYR